MRLITQPPSLQTTRSAAATTTTCAPRWCTDSAVTTHCSACVGATFPTGISARYTALGLHGRDPDRTLLYIGESDFQDARFITAHGDDPEYGIATYIWMLTNRKTGARRGRVQLIDATGWSEQLRRNLGKKNCQLSGEQIEAICDLLLHPRETDQSKRFSNAAFGYWKLTVDRPLRLAADLSPERLERFAATCAKVKEAPLANLARRVGEVLGPGPHLDFNVVMAACEADASAHNVKLTAKRKKALQAELTDTREDAAPVVKKRHKPGKATPDPIHGRYAILLPSPSGKGVGVEGKKAVVEFEADTALRDTEQVPLLEDGGPENDPIAAVFRREVLPYTADAWIDPDKTQIGYEISFTRHFYKPAPMRTLEEIKADIAALEQENEGLLEQIVGEAV